MRKDSSRNDSSTTRGPMAGSRGKTALGTPAMTSLGLFHQQKIAAEREALPQESAHASDVIEDLANKGEERDNPVLEWHMSTAKDGVIEMLTAKASKLGASLERALVAKRGVEDRVSKTEALLEIETTKLKDLEHRLQRQQTDSEYSLREKESLKQEVACLRGKLAGVEQRYTAWIQEETYKKRAAEEALAQEHSVAKEYLRKSSHREIGGSGVGDDERGTATELLVRELNILEEALRKRDADLSECDGRLKNTVEDLEAEQDRRQAIQHQLALTQDRLDVTKNKFRQLSSQLQGEVGDNQALRERLHAMDEENELRVKKLQERKDEGQRRKRGDARDMMAGIKAKDDRIKKLETALIQERERLEGDLRSARSDYEEAVRESRRKNARLQRRCLELEYMLSTQSERSTKRGSEDGNDISSLSSRGGVPRAGSGPVSRRSAETSTPSFVGTSSRRGVVGGGGLISAASMLPWRRGSGSSMASETSSPSGVDGAGTIMSGGAATPVSKASAMPDRKPQRRSADHLPDPSRNNSSAPAWMREDLAIDRVKTD